MTLKDRFTTAGFTLVIALLAAAALRPVMAQRAVRSAGPYKYTAVQVHCHTPGNCPADLQAALDNYANNGWELVGPVQSDVPGIGLTLIFKQ